MAKQKQESMAGWQEQVDAEIERVNKVLQEKQAPRLNFEG